MKKIKHTIVAAAMFLGTAQIGMAGGYDQRGMAVDMMHIHGHVIIKKQIAQCLTMLLNF